MIIKTEKRILVITSDVIVAACSQKANGGYSYWKPGSDEGVVENISPEQFQQAYKAAEVASAKDDEFAAGLFGNTDQA